MADGGRDSYEKHRREQVKNIFASIKEILEKDFECKGLNSRKEIVTQCTLILRTYSDSSDPKQNWARQRADGTPGLNLMLRHFDTVKDKLTALEAAVAQLQLEKAELESRVGSGASQSHLISSFPAIQASCASGPLYSSGTSSPEPATSVRDDQDSTDDSGDVSTGFFGRFQPECWGEQEPTSTGLSSLSIPVYVQPAPSFNSDIFFQHEEDASSSSSDHSSPTGVPPQSSLDVTDFSQVFGQYLPNQPPVANVQPIDKNIFTDYGARTFMVVFTLLMVPILSLWSGVSWDTIAGTISTGRVLSTLQTLPVPTLDVFSFPFVAFLWVASFVSYKAVISITVGLFFYTWLYSLCDPWSRIPEELWARALDENSLAKQVSQSFPEREFHHSARALEYLGRPLPTSKIGIYAGTFFQILRALGGMLWFGVLIERFLVPDERSLKAGTLACEIYLRLLRRAHLRERRRSQMYLVLAAYNLCEIVAPEIRSELFAHVAHHINRIFPSWITVRKVILFIASRLAAMGSQSEFSLKYLYLAASIGSFHEGNWVDVKHYGTRWMSVCASEYQRSLELLKKVKSCKDPANTYWTTEGNILGDLKEILILQSYVASLLANQSISVGDIKDANKYLDQAEAVAYSMHEIWGHSNSMCLRLYSQLLARNLDQKLLEREARFWKQNNEVQRLLAGSPFYVARFSLVSAIAYARGDADKALRHSMKAYGTFMRLPVKCLLTLWNAPALPLFIDTLINIVTDLLESGTEEDLYQAHSLTLRLDDALAKFSRVAGHFPIFCADNHRLQARRALQLSRENDALWHIKQSITISSKLEQKPILARSLLDYAENFSTEGPIVGCPRYQTRAGILEHANELFLQFGSTSEAKRCQMLLDQDLQRYAVMVM